MIHPRFSLGLACTFAFALSGCAYENAAQRAEIEKKNTLLTEQAHVDDLLDKPTLASARYAFRLSDAYKTLGDTAAANRDALAGGLIVAAGASALGAATSAGSRELAQVAVLGIGLNEAVRYTNQGGATDAFYKASDEMACIASSTIGVIGSETHQQLADTALVLEFTRRAELRLRARLRRTAPDFISLGERFRQGITGGLPAQIVQGARTTSALRTALKKCLPKENTVSGGQTPTQNPPPTPTPAPVPTPEPPPNDPTPMSPNDPTIVSPQI